MRPALCAILLIVSHSILFAQAPDFYEKHWSRVYKYEVQVLPKSALAVVDTIYAAARRENNVSQLLKVLLYQIA